MMNPAELWRHARAAQAAYIVEEDKLVEAVEKLGYSFIARLVNDELTAFVTVEDDEAQITIQGTRVIEHTDGAEIWDDLDNDSILLPNGAGLVHGGFFRPLARCWPDIKACIPQGAKRVLLRGHSLGGVRAHLGLRLAKDTGMPASAVSFGAPKGGDKNFWATLDIHPERVVNRRDFAPLWPIADSRWVQPGPMTWIDGGNVLQTVIGWRGTFPSIRDHNVDTYVSELARLAGIS
jgi:hypothetical protein